MKHTSIRRFLLLGLGAIAVAFVVLSVSWLLSVARLQEMKTRLFTDTQSLENSYRLELAVRSTQNDPMKRIEAEREADWLIERLPDSATSPAETALVQTVAANFRLWREGGALGATQALLTSIEEHRALNQTQMRQTMRRGERLESTLRVISPLLIGLSALALGVGGWKLWTKIFTPMLRLSRAAEEFGKGALWSRAPILCEDEMGDLCRTFNHMADAIGERETERLRFVATVAHDLKNPLMVVGMAAGLMRKKELPPEHCSDWLERIGRNTRQMEGIITDLTDGVQAQTGALELQREPLDLSQLAASVVGEQSEALQCEARQNGRDPASASHSLRFEGETSCPILGDRKRLERVLINLLSNAIKYSPRGSEVRVSVWRRGLIALLSVEDQGEGIAPEDLPRLFQPFARLQNTRHMASGTGLGLVSTQKIIHAHGGNIRISSPPARGTVVEISLHLREPHN